MKFKIILIFQYLFYFSILSQSSITGTFQVQDNTIILYALNGIGEDLISEIQVKNGQFKYNVPDSLESCLLLLENKNNHSNKLFLIYNHQPIQFTTNKNWNPDSTIFKSDENKALRLYEKEVGLVKQKVRIINSLIGYYPEKDKIYHGIINGYPSISKKLNQLTDSIHKALPNSFASPLIKASPVFIPSLETSIEEQRELYINNFWNKFPFENTAIIRSDVYINNVKEYLLLHTNRSLTKEDQNRLFKKAIFNLFSNKIDSEVVKVALQNNIHDFFLGTGNVKMAYFMDKNYMSNSCKSSTQEKANERMLAYEKTQPGNTAPNIEAIDLKEKSRVFSEKEKNAKYTIITFWSSTCGHCQESLPELQKISKSYSTKNINFIGISLDSDIKSWKEFISVNNLDNTNWTHLREENGWKSQTAQKFGIQATPTYFIVNDQWLIEKRPSNTFEINEFLLNKTSNND